MTRAETGNYYIFFLALGCLVTLLTVTVVISAIRVTVARRPRTDYQIDHRLVHPDR